MTTPSLFKEYIWLVNTIKQAGHITFAEIQERWLDTEMSEGVDLARSTFNRHKDAIQDIFGINIECDRKNSYTYYIENDEVLREETVQNWMLSAMSVTDIISQSKSLHQRIVLQQVPCSGHLELFIRAMKQKVRVLMSYCRYESQNTTSVTCEPYCLKLFNQRWYVLAHFHRDATQDKPERDYYGVYAFDRIQSLQLTDIKFEVRSDFDAQLFFSVSVWWLEMEPRPSALCCVPLVGSAIISMICLSTIASNALRKQTTMRTTPSTSAPRTISVPIC